MMDEASKTLVRTALAEDLGGHGDITSQWTIPAGTKAHGAIVARETLVVCGLPLAEETMRTIDSKTRFACLVEDGATVAAGQELATLDGSARGILTAERTMLNFLIHLSGVATQSERFSRAVEGTEARVVDTRKTHPGLRVWEKRAVVCGGCYNHRFGLFDMVLIKNNHLVAAGGVKPAMERARAARPHYTKIEVEVENEADLREAIACKADIVMLDNQELDSLRRMVEVARELDPEVTLEASGRVKLDTVRAIAETGVDLISTSALTMGAPPVDLSLSLAIGG